MQHSPHTNAATAVAVPARPATASLGVYPGIHDVVTEKRALPRPPRSVARCGYAVALYALFRTQRRKSRARPRARPAMSPVAGQRRPLRPPSVTARRPNEKKSSLFFSGAERAVLACAVWRSARDAALMLGVRAARRAGGPRHAPRAALVPAARGGGGASGTRRPCADVRNEAGVYPGIHR